MQKQQKSWGIRISVQLVFLNDVWLCKVETQQYKPIIYYINTVNTQRMQIPDVLLQLGYIWRHVSAVNRPSSGQQGIVLLRYSQILSNWIPLFTLKLETL